MKKLLLLLVLFVTISSCDNGDGSEERGEALASSVHTFGSYSMEGEWSFDGNTLELSGENNLIRIESETDTSVSLRCYVTIPDPSESSLRYSVVSNAIFLAGEPGNVTFDYPNKSITFSERLSETSQLVHSIDASVKGWIKRDRPNLTRLTPATWPYDCNINIECEVDGKPLKLHITRMNNYASYGSL